jgi:4-amino-4-deoxy-L-arabinose transferase-like glycosyltransferase
VSETAVRSPRRRDVVVVAILVFLVGAALRLGFVWESLAEPSLRTPTPGLDAQVAWAAAGALKDGVPVQPNLELMMVSAPAFPYWLAGIRLAVGDDMTLARVVLALLGAARLSLVVLIALQLTGRLWAAAGAGLLLAFLPSLIYFDGSLFKVGTDLTLLTLLVFATVWPRGSARSSWRGGLAVGVLLALCFLSQLLTLAYVAAICAYAVLAPWPWASRWRFVVGAVTVVAIVGTGFLLRSRFVGDESPRFLSRAGVDLRIAFHERATGFYRDLPGVSPWPAGHAFEARMLAELESGRRMTWREADAHHTRAALRFVREHPARALILVWTKASYFVNDFEIKGEDYLPYIKRYSSVLRWSPVSFGWLFVLGMLGTHALLLQRRLELVALLGGLLLCVLAANVFGFVMSRFRLPAVIPLALLAAPGLVSLAELGRDGTWRRSRQAAALTIAVAVIAGWLTFRPALAHTDRGFLRRAEENRQLSIAAEQAAARLGTVDERARVSLLEQMGRRTEAFAALQRLAGHHVADEAANRAYLRYLLWLSRYDEAARHLERVCREAGPGAHAGSVAGRDVVALILRRFVSTAREGCRSTAAP